MRASPLRPCGGFSAASGFSLVEVLIATGLLVTAIASLAQLFAVATRANFDAGDMTWATVLAAQRIEELRSEPFPERLVDQSIEYLDSRGDRLDTPASAGRRAYTRAGGSSAVVRVRPYDRDHRRRLAVQARRWRHA